MQKLKGVFTVLCLGISQTALSHPHAFIEMQTDFLTENQLLLGFRMHWLFDQPASSEMLYELKISKNKEKTRQEFANKIMQNIVKQHYFSHFYDQNNQPISYTSKPNDYSLNAVGNQLLFAFNFYLSKPRPLNGFSGTLSSYDPSYYVAMTYPQTPKINTEAPCEVRLQTPTVDDFLKNYASSLDKNQRDEDMTLGAQFAQKVILQCR